MVGEWPSRFRANSADRLSIGQQCQQNRNVGVWRKGRSAVSAALRGSSRLVCAELGVGGEIDKDAAEFLATGLSVVQRALPTRPTLDRQPRLLSQRTLDPPAVVASSVPSGRPLLVPTLLLLALTLVPLPVWLESACVALSFRGNCYLAANCINLAATSRTIEDRPSRQCSPAIGLRGLWMMSSFSYLRSST